MLKFKEAEDASHRMLAEAHRYDTARQRSIAMTLLADVEKRRACGLAYGMQVQLQELRSDPALNGQSGIIVGISPSRDRYFVGVGRGTIAARRVNIDVLRAPGDRDIAATHDPCDSGSDACPKTALQIQTHESRRSVRAEWDLEAAVAHVEVDACSSASQERAGL